MAQKPDKILKALKLVVVPARLEEFEEAVEKYVKTWGECREVKLIWDENPTYVIKPVSNSVQYRKEHHLDKIVCDGKEYELEAVYEFYDIDAGDFSMFIVHSFNPIEVREKKPE
jgi:hypothetical protein